MWQAIKRLVFWDYGRTAWQYDVLCLLILAFIFLTPKNWFESKGRALVPPENARIGRLIVSPENFGETDEAARLRRVRELSGNADAVIVGWRERRDESGKIVAYEVDVR